MAEESKQAILRRKIFKSPKSFQDVAKYGTPIILGTDIRRDFADDISLLKRLALIIPDMQTLMSDAEKLKFRKLLLSSINGEFHDEILRFYFEEPKMVLNIDQLLLGYIFDSSMAIIRSDSTLRPNLEEYMATNKELITMPYIHLNSDDSCIHEATIPSATTATQLIFIDELWLLIIAHNDMVNFGTRRRLSKEEPWYKEPATSDQL